MGPVERREFLKMAGGGALAIAATALPLAGILEWSGANRLEFRAAVGMPSNPLPAYASYVVEGNLDLVQGKGTVRKSVYFGAPNAMSNILFPGAERLIQVTDIQRSGGTIKIAGVVDDSATLGQQESRNASMVIDLTRKTAQADFLGRTMLLRLQ
jgi:hypothetical protein